MLLDITNITIYLKLIILLVFIFLLWYNNVVASVYWRLATIYF